MITTFNRLPLPDQLRVVKKVKANKTLLEIVKMLTDVDPIIIIDKCRKWRLPNNHGLLDN